MQRDLFDVVTLAIALLGAVLGIFSTWRMWLNDRVRLRVRVATGYIPGQPKTMLIEVVNLSSFPVTITGVGFHLLGTDHHIALPAPVFTAPGGLPKRLEPRTAATVIQSFAAFENEQLRVLRNAYVRTACGVTSKGGRNYLRKVNRMARAAAVEQPDP